MINSSRKQLVSAKGEHSVLVVEEYLKRIPLPPESYLIIPWESAASILTDLCDIAGGDEDFLIVTTSKNTLPYYIERMNRYGDLDEYHLEEFTIYVVSH